MPLALHPLCSGASVVRGAGLGRKPTASTALPGLIDAYFWLKTPGESDGCTEVRACGMTVCMRGVVACADGVGASVVAHGNRYSQMAQGALVSIGCVQAWTPSALLQESHERQKRVAGSSPSWQSSLATVKSAASPSVTATAEASCTRQLLPMASHIPNGMRSRRKASQRS